MIRGFEPKPKWSLRSSAVNGSLAGLVIAVVHQVHHVISNTIPDNISTHVLGEIIAATARGAILFTGSAVRAKTTGGIAVPRFLMLFHQWHWSSRVTPRRNKLQPPTIMRQSDMAAQRDYFRMIRTS
ncbi:hypothetical protein [Microvirga zambiensis]|uniref:hypothetical protein n=1 Tax=Microvirga zambiensis TaxID=1402137 RepID=UPI00191FE057|nr:hypothetical protein [Microvirga zambiensis]